MRQTPSPSAKRLISTLLAIVLTTLFYPLFGGSHSAVAHVIRDRTIDFADRFKNPLDELGELFKNPPSGSSAATGADQKATDILNTYNKAGVHNGPPNLPQFTIDQPMRITHIQTYHWNNRKGTQQAGQIGITGKGFWQAKGQSGMFNTPNAEWIARPNVVLEPGTYFVIDSDLMTWSTNDKAKGMGFAIVRGVPANAVSPPGNMATKPQTSKPKAATPKPAPAPVQPKPASAATIAGTARLTVSPQGPVPANSRVEVTWSAGSKLHFQSFIAIVDPDQPRSGRMPRYYRRKLIGRNKTGTWKARVPGKAGQFELRLYDPWNRKTITSIPLKVKSAPTASRGKTATGKTPAPRPSAGSSAGSGQKSNKVSPAKALLQRMPNFLAGWMQWKGRSSKIYMALTIDKRQTTSKGAVFEGRLVYRSERSGKESESRARLVIDPQSLRFVMTESETVAQQNFDTGGAFRGTIDNRTLVMTGTWSKPGFKRQAQMELGPAPDEPHETPQANQNTQPAPKPKQTASAKPGATLIDNWNKGGCGFTDTIRFSLKRKTAIGQFRTWINWPKGVATVDYTITQDGNRVHAGSVRRASCDPYQQTWCQGVDSWNRTLEAGTYTIKTALKRVCQNNASKRNGYIALHAATGNVGQGGDTNDANSTGDADIQGQYYDDEDDGGDFAGDMSTRGIIKRQPTGARASGYMPPGDVDIVRFGLQEDTDIKVTLRPCTKEARMRLLDANGRELMSADDVTFGYYGLYTSRSVPNLKKGVYAVEVSHTGSKPCGKDRKYWVVEVAPDWKTVHPAKLTGNNARTKEKKSSAATKRPSTTGDQSGGDRFMMVPNAGIPGHNKEIRDGVSVAACKRICLERSWCKSFDYERGANKCYLQPVDQNDEQLKHNYSGNPYDHYMLTPQDTLKTGGDEQFLKEEAALRKLSSVKLFSEWVSAVKKAGNRATYNVTETPAEDCQGQACNWCFRFSEDLSSHTSYFATYCVNAISGNVESEDGF